MQSGGTGYRAKISTNVSVDWYWDPLHALSILNEEFNHDLGALRKTA
jgi:hypothetical protein